MGDVFQCMRLVNESFQCNLCLSFNLSSLSGSFPYQIRLYLYLYRVTPVVMELCLFCFILKSHHCRTIVNACLGQFLLEHRNWFKSSKYIRISST